jgi:hypothetical protein
MSSNEVVSKKLDDIRNAPEPFRSALLAALKARSPYQQQASAFSGLAQLEQ